MDPMTDATTQWQNKMIERYTQERNDGLHDYRCEWRARGFWLCNCSKRRRVAEGFTEPPKDDLYFPPPDCPHCDGTLGHDGDGWCCDDCSLSWDSDGSGDSARFTDDNDDLADSLAHWESQWAKEDS
jgi:hypothetical protein